MSCLFPGAPDVDAYWQNILGKVDAVTDPPPEAWDTDVYYDPDFGDTDKVYCKRGGYLGALASFDPLAYGVPPVVGRRRARPVARAQARVRRPRRRRLRRPPGGGSRPDRDRARQGHLPQRRQRDRRAARARRRPDAGSAQAAPPRVHGRRARAAPRGDEARPAADQRRKPSPGSSPTSSSAGSPTGST